MRFVLVLIAMGFLTAHSLAAHESAAPPPGIAALFGALSPNEANRPAYNTIEEAAVHAIERAYKCSHYYECGGSIAQRPDGKFVFGPVRSDHSGDSTGIRHGVPDGYKLVGDYHTHPCNADTHYIAYFSDADMSQNTMFKITGFMGDLCTGKVHAFTPGRDSPNNEQPDPDKPFIWLTQGRIVGQIKVDGKSVEPDTDD